MPFAQRDGVTLAYEATGAGEPPLVFVHGWSCDRSFFAPQVAELAHEHRVVAVDLRGHGDSDQPAEGYRVESFAADVWTVAEAEQLHRPVLIGHSLGALVALAAAAHGTASAVIMVDPAAVIATQESREFAVGTAAAVADDVDGSWRTRLVRGMFLDSDTARREETIQLMSARPPRVAAATVRAIAEFDGEAALRRCSVPVLVIGSAVPMNSSDALREACPSITIGQTVGAGHFLQLEVPDQVNAMIRRFLAIHGLGPTA